MEMPAGRLQAGSSGEAEEAAVDLATVDAVEAGETDPMEGAGQAAGEAADAQDLADRLAPSVESDTRAREQIEALLAVAEIVTVICVDDNFEPDLGVILDAIARTPAEISELVSGELGVDVGDDPAETRSIWGPAVEEAWEARDEGARRRYASGVMRLLEEEHQSDVGRLGDLLPETVKFSAITASEWEETHKQSVLDGATNKTLVLFDRAHGADKELGIKLAADLHEADAAGAVWAGLLTHTVDPNQEIDQGALLAAMDERIVPERFVVISKKHLDAIPSTFPHGLKVTLMAPAAHRLRHAVTDAITAGTASAQKQLELDPYEFERAVFSTAATEGIWEPDMLLRLFNVLIRAEVRESLHDSPPIAGDARLLRQFSAVNLAPNENQSLAAARGIRKLEVYEEPGHLNGRHLPVELGDIFEVTVPDGTKQAVLVEQPCDLMVRSQSGAGKRGNNLVHAHLLELRADQHPYSFELPAFADGEAWYAWFTKLMVLPLSALDYCVFDGSGASRLDTSAEPPAGLWPAWEARYPILTKDAKKLVAAVSDDKLEGLTNEGVKKDLVKHRSASHFGATKPIECSIEGSVVAFNLKRVNRLLQPYNRALLGAYSAYRARADFEPDFPVATDMAS